MNARIQSLVLGCLAPIVALACTLSLRLEAAELPPADTRADTVADLNTLRSFPGIDTRAAWEQRARAIREHAQVCCGLWPMPEKTPLQARVFGRIEREGYSVEKVVLQTWPGFYLGANLYRPLGRGNGPFPAILNPHGHWGRGRINDTPDGSVPARCINFARQGMIALAIDMIGYNDTVQFPDHRAIAMNPTNQLWNISLMGLQVWNEVRCLDFLESLPEVDRTRLGCTGASGGGTQTFMLGAVDPRLAVQAPIVMVSHSMQGGCLCENAPGLRVDYSNMEYAAAPAPRPQILVAARGDWTRDTLSIEGPSIANMYRLLRAEDRLRYVRFDFDHNYNRTSREAVYAWFDHCLLNAPLADSVPERDYKPEPDADLRAFPDAKLPADALPQDQFLARLVATYQKQIEALKPTNRASLASYKRVMGTVWTHALQVESPTNLLTTTPASQVENGLTTESLCLGRADKGDRLPVVIMRPPRATRAVVLVHPDGKSAHADAAGQPLGLARTLTQQGMAVVLIDTFLTGELARAGAQAKRQIFTNFFTTYNRTELQQRVQDLATVCAYARRHFKSVALCGTGRAGLWTLMAAPVADVVVADACQLPAADDASLLAPDLFTPGLRRLGGFEGAAALAAPHPVLIHNTGSAFPTRWITDTYAAAGARKAARIEPAALPDEAIARWLKRAR